MLSFTIPSCKNVSPCAVLNVEPGGYVPIIARFKSGFFLSCCSILWFFPRWRPSINSGLKVGAETMQRISPVDGSIATIAPILFCINRSPSCCNLMSIPNLRFLPGTDGLSFAPSLYLPWMRPCASRRRISTPFSPRRYCSYDFSMPCCPA